MPHAGDETGSLSPNGRGAQDPAVLGKGETDVAVSGGLTLGSSSAQHLCLYKRLEESVEVLTPLSKLSHNKSPEVPP